MCNPWVGKCLGLHDEVIFSNYMLFANQDVLPTWIPANVGFTAYPAIFLFQIGAK